MTDRNVPAVPAEEAADEAAMQDWAELLVERARAEGVELTGDGGLLTGLVRQVLQTGLEVEMADHLGYERHDPEGRGSGNSRNGSSPKRVITEIGEIDLRVPRDRAGTFEPVTVPKHQRRLDGLSGNVISLYANGLTTGEIQAHLADIYDTSVSRETISKITDEIVADMAVWQSGSRQRDRVYRSGHELFVQRECRNNSKWSTTAPPSWPAPQTHLNWLRSLRTRPLQSCDRHL